MAFGFLKFEEQFMERIWGGTQLQRTLNKTVPEGKVIGESWLISDHASCQSVVCEGPHAGQTLHALLERNPEGMLGTQASRNHEGRFPLLLKLIDAEEDLSVQVHPDDEQAHQLGETDAGKTEMWYLLGTEGACEIILGICPGISRAAFEERLRFGDVYEMMCRFPVSSGDAVFVAAGSSHAIGGGALLAEIQQNSNITYRLFDYNRLDKGGRPRELHLEKGLAVTRFEGPSGGRIAPLRRTESGAVREFLSACRYFAAEKVQVLNKYCHPPSGRSFHIVLALDNAITLAGDSSTCRLRRGEAALIPAVMPAWEVSGPGAYLDYYVPDLKEDIILPLRRHGYVDSQIKLLGGTARDTDLELALNNCNRKTSPE